MHSLAANRLDFSNEVQAHFEVGQATGIAMFTKKKVEIFPSSEIAIVARTLKLVLKIPYLS